MKKIILFIILFLTKNILAQNIQGYFPEAKNKEIILKGFEGYAEKEFSKTTTDSLGNFTLTYPKNYLGAALLQIQNTSSVILLLNQESIKMQWENLQDFNTLKFTNSFENSCFTEGIIINQEAESKLNGLKFLLSLYKKQPKQQQWLTEEITNQEQQFDNFLNQLPKSSYVKYYLKIRKLITDISYTANHFIERMPQHENEFNTLNFNEPKLYTSGLLKELINSYFQLIERLANREEMYKHINTSTAALLKSLSQNSTLQQEIAQHLFTNFEKKSLYIAAEYLALIMLNQSNCQLSEKNTNIFEQYRKLAIGKTAPNIKITPNNKSKLNDLKSIKSTYKLVVFGATWCPNCQTDYPSLIEKYTNLKNKYDLEIVYISIDTDKDVFESYYKEAPFITFCDIKGWETQAAKDYHIFATPTYLLLDTNLKIVAKINSPEHLEVWLQANNIN